MFRFLEVPNSVACSVALNVLPYHKQCLFWHLGCTNCKLVTLHKTALMVVMMMIVFTITISWLLSPLTLFRVSFSSLGQDNSSFSSSSWGTLSACLGCSRCARVAPNLIGTLKKVAALSFCLDCPLSSLSVSVCDVSSSTTTTTTDFSPHCCSNYFRVCFWSGLHCLLHFFAQSIVCLPRTFNWLLTQSLSLLSNSWSQTLHIYETGPGEERQQQWGLFSAGDALLFGGR